MLSKTTNVLFSIVAGLFIATFVYLGVERLLLSKFNEITIERVKTAQFSAAYRKCQVNLNTARLLAAKGAALLK